jgi:PTH1 family peptidyl-tRNA hydrolase
MEILGIKSVIEKLGTTSFPRLRIGIDRPDDKNQVHTWVLGRFSEEELFPLEETIFPAVWNEMQQFIRRTVKEKTIHRSFNPEGRRTSDPAQ